MKLTLTVINLSLSEVEKIMGSRLFPKEEQQSLKNKVTKGALDFLGKGLNSYPAEKVIQMYVEKKGPAQCNQWLIQQEISARVASMSVDFFGHSTGVLQIEIEEISFLEVWKEVMSKVNTNNSPDTQSKLSTLQLSLMESFSEEILKEIPNATMGKILKVTMERCQEDLIEYLDEMFEEQGLTCIVKEVQLEV